MSIVLSEHVLSELESLLAEVKHEIAKREAALASSATPETSSATSVTGTTEVGSVAAPAPLPDAVADANDTPAAAPPAARSGTLKRPPRTPAEPAAEPVPVPAPPSLLPPPPPPPQPASRPSVSSAPIIDNFFMIIVSKQVTRWPGTDSGSSREPVRSSLPTDEAFWNR